MVLETEGRKRGKPFSKGIPLFLPSTAGGMLVF